MNTTRNIEFLSSALELLGIYHLEKDIGAYQYEGPYWYPESQWLPSELDVPKNMKRTQLMAEKYAITVIDATDIKADLPEGIVGGP